MLTGGAGDAILRLSKSNNGASICLAHFASCPSKPPAFSGVAGLGCQHRLAEANAADSSNDAIRE
jgi:hypothetical protein